MTHNTVVAPRAGDIHLKTQLNVPLKMIPVIFSHSLFVLQFVSDTWLGFKYITSFEALF